MIWSNEFLTRLKRDGETELVNNEAITIFDRAALATNIGIATYQIPSYIKRIVQVTWKGKVLSPLEQFELKELDWTYRTNVGIPEFYTRISDNFNMIRFYPVPDETISDVGDVDGADIQNLVILSVWRAPNLSDTDFDIPAYIGRHVIKNYVLKEAYAIDGVGQNFTAVKYFEMKWKKSLDYTLKVKERLKQSITYQLGSNMNLTRGRRPPRPHLPPNFGVEV